MSDGANALESIRLPAAFSDLEAVTAWALPTERERYEKRLASSMPELQAFYNLVCPRAAAARDYLDSLHLTDMPLEAQRLMWLLFSLITVSYAVDVFGVPRVPDSGSAYMERAGEPQTFPV
jgi:hypothetical protein